MRNKIYVHQIYYDELTKAKLDEGFIPLDNTKNERPDWFEFWPMLNYLNSHELEEDAWYGFLSPRFQEKMGVDSQYINKVIEQHGHAADALLISPAWDQICYFQNPWEQGEVWHPGITEESQKFFDFIGYSIDLQNTVTNLNTTIFSNYIIAKKIYWLEWKRIANLFWAYVEGEKIDGRIRKNTSYGSVKNQQPMKVFIQERFANVIIIKNKLSSIAFDQSLNGPIFSRLFSNNSYSRKILITCDILKRFYLEKKEPQYIAIFREIRSLVRGGQPSRII
jgi:hypothetical protein